MKKLLFILSIGCLLIGCRSDIDLGNIDTATELEMGVALPVGSIKLTVGDILGDSSIFFVETDATNNGVLTWVDTISMSKDFHNVDLRQYFSTVEMPMKFKDQLKSKFADAYELPGFDTLYIPLIGESHHLELDFPIDLPLTGINEDKAFSERLDRANIKEAYFVSLIRPQDLPFEWEWLNSIELDLGDRFKRDDKKVIIYSKERGDNFGFGDSIPIIIDNFTLDMMKLSPEELKQKWNPYGTSPNQEAMAYGLDNVYDTCSFAVKFDFTLPGGTLFNPYILKVTPNSGINYSLGVRFLDFTAIWGMFDPSKDMRDENVKELGQSWGDLEFLSKAHLPFSDPTIDVDITTQIAGAMVINDAYLYTLATDENQQESKDTTWATFNGNRYQNFTTNDLRKHGGNYLDPNTSSIDDWAHFKMSFTNKPEEGAIHNLFKKVPQKLGYRFAVDFNRFETAQIRIVPSTAIKIEAVCKLPMMFGPGVNIHYADTMRDVSVSQISVDSLLSSLGAIDTVKTTDVTAYIKAVNYIPLGVKVVLQFLDESGNIIMDPDSVTKPMSIIEGDTIHVKPVNYTKMPDGSMPMSPSEDFFAAKLSKAKLEKFSQIKHITYQAVIDNEGLTEAFKQGLPSTKITPEEYLVLKIGLTADIDAVIRFNSKEITDELQ